MLLSLAFSNTNANTAACTNNETPATVQLTNPEAGLDPGDGGGNGNGHGNGGNTGGNTGQTPPSP